VSGSSYTGRPGILIDQMSEPWSSCSGFRDYPGHAVEGVPFGPDAWQPGGWHFDSVVDEVTDYVTSLVEGRMPAIDSWDTAYALRVIEATYASVRSGEPVRVDSIEGVGATSQA
jgi:predicted dehydrogenase